MVQLSFNLLALVSLVAITCAGGNAVPTTRDAKCSKLNYGPFELHLVSDDGKERPYPLLLTMTTQPRPTNDTYFVFRECTTIPGDFDRAPSQWTLDDGVLKPVYKEPQVYPTINLPLKADSRLGFLSSDEDSLEGRGSPDYCVTRTEKAEDGSSALLAGSDGDTESFSICTGVSNEAPRCQDLYYKVDPKGYGASMRCTKVHLVIHST